LLSDVDFAVGEPSMEMKIIHGEDGGGEGMPVNVLRFVSPVSHRITYGEVVGGLVAGCKSNASVQKHNYKCK
jgi:hypothetical protein